MDVEEEQMGEAGALEPQGKSRSSGEGSTITVNFK